MSNKLKNKGYKWLSSLIVCSMILQIVPVSGLSIVLAEENHTEQVKKVSKEHVSQNEREEIISKRTENSKTFLNADGTFRAEISQKPIHFKNNSNKWEPIDNDLVANRAEKVFENKANAFKAKFDQKHTPDSPFLELEDEQGSIELQLEPLEHTDEKPSIVEGIVDGESITYPEVFPNIDIKYTVGTDRIKEDIIYSEKPAAGFPERFTYKLDLKGMKIKESEGTLYLYDEKSNIPLYYFDSPYMYDSYKPKGYQSISEIESIPEESISYDIQLKHEVIDNQLFLHVIPNKTWLEDPSRIYPVTIDPTLVKLQSSTFVEDTNIRSATPTQTGGNDLELAGGKSGTNVIRGLLKFDLSSIPAATTIMDANLNLWYSSTNNNTPINVSVHRLTKEWEENQASWNYAKNSPSTPWTVKGGDFVSTPISTVYGIEEVVDLAIAETKWDIPTTLISSWITNSLNNYGLILKSDTENVNTYKKFISSEHSIGSQYHPLLVVTYKTTARLGLEDYWKYDNHPLVGGNSFTNLTTGNNVIQYQDFNLPARGGYGFGFIRTYNAKSLEKSIFGYGWTASGLENLFIDNSQNTLEYTDEDGTTHTFTYDAKKGLYMSGPGMYLTIRNYTTPEYGRISFYELLNKYGEKVVFKANKVDFNTSMQTANLEYREDRHGNRITFQYENDRLTQISSQLSPNLVKNIDLTYNPAGFVDTASYEGNIFTYEYDSSGKVKKVGQLKSNNNYTSTKFEYKDNRISAIVDPNNRRTDYAYKNEILSKVQEPEIKGTVDLPDRPGTEYLLDIPNKKSTVIDPNKNEITYYTNDNYVVTKVLSGGIATQYLLDSNYNVETENTDGSITSMTYDSNGNVLTTTDPEGNKQIYTYTNYSNVQTQTDSIGKKTTNTYNTVGDLEKIEIPDSNAKEGKLVTLFDYDEFGDIKSVTQPDGSKQSITIDYTSSEITEENTDAFENISSTKTDLLGNVKESRDGKNKFSFYKYNSKNELEEVKDRKQKITSYGYDDNGNINSIVNALNFTSNYLYNGQNQMKEEKNNIGKITTYDFDNNGNLTDIHLPSNGIIHRKYDELNRLTEMYSNNILKWKYNFEGDKLASINQGAKLNKSFDYYNNDYLKSVQEGSNLIEYVYNGAEYTSQVKYTVGTRTPTVIDYVLDDVNRIKEIKKNGQSIPVVSFEYSQDGLPKAISYVNGSSLSLQYDRSRLTGYTMKSSATNELDAYALEYDANQNINKITSNVGIMEYDYDELNQLKTEKLSDGTMLTYVYDDTGNRKEKNRREAGVTTTTAYAYNGANQLIKVDSQDYQYDDNGNLTSDGNKTYIFNNFNQLEAIKDTSGQTIASYTYDEEGKRNSTNVSGKTVNYYYDGDQVLYETDGNNNVLREYTYDANGYPLTMTTNGETYYYLVNYHGDVMALTDTAGNVVAAYSYDVWGNIQSQSGGELAELNPYRYAGYRYDENTKLYYLMARYYNPDNGVFLSIDPIRGDLEDPITLNGYNYANNNPLMNYDPDGQRPKVPPVIMGVFVATSLLVKSLSKGVGKSTTNVTKLWDIKTFSKGKVTYSFSGQKVTAYKDATKKGYWWAKDTTGHADSAFKVFEKRGNELHWVADADKYGNFIKGKHKSKTGTIIKLK